MTKETAIELLSHCAVEHGCMDGIRGHCEGCNQRIALDMAIIALSAERQGKCDGCYYVDKKGGICCEFCMRNYPDRFTER